MRNDDPRLDRRLCLYRPQGRKARLFPAWLPAGALLPFRGWNTLGEARPDLDVLLGSLLRGPWRAELAWLASVGLFNSAVPQYSLREELPLLEALDALSAAWINNVRDSR